MDYQSILRKNRKKALALLSDLTKKATFSKLSYSQEDIKKIIPHREPFLLVDKLHGIDLDKKNETIIGSRFIPADDPVFSGHFPDSPLYPGSLQIEMAGQLGLCLSYFVMNSRNSIAADARPVSVRATKILGALFLEPLLPENPVRLISKNLEYDDFFGTVISQVISKQKICCVCISQVFFPDE